jgi:hypothetical protein
MKSKNITLAGGVPIRAVFEDGHEEELLVRQLKLKEWPQAMTCLDDEIGLVAIACTKTRPQILELTPASYNEAHAAMKGANAAGFFTYAQRRLDRAAEDLRAMPPDMVEKMFRSRSTSSMPPPPIPPPAG